MNEQPISEPQRDARHSNSARTVPTWIKPEFLLSQILLALVLSLIIAGWSYYKREKAAFERAAESELSAVVSLKAAQIVQWREERLADANLILDASLLNSTVREALEVTTNTEASTLTANWMSAFRKHGGCSRIVLLDSNLKPRLTIPENENWVGLLDLRFAGLAFHTNRILASELLHSSQVSGEVNLDIFVPLGVRYEGPDRQPVAAGVFMLETKLNDSLFPHLQTWPTPSPTAETLLVRREGDEVVYLNELRHRTNTALKLRRSITASPNAPATRAALGQEGPFQGIDYRGKAVFSAIRQVPSSSWAVIAKMDAVEVYAPLHQRAWAISLMMGALMLAGALGIRLVWRNREYRFSQRELEERKQTEKS